MESESPINKGNCEYSLGQREPGFALLSIAAHNQAQRSTPAHAIHAMEKFGFRIQTRSGLTVDNLIIQAVDQPTAETRLKQMYLGCTILEAKVLDAPMHRGDVADLEGVINLISQNKPG